MKIISNFFILSSLLIFIGCSESNNNKPVDTDTQNTENTTPVVAPVTIDNEVQSLSTGGVNPAHGEPGHRCEIAVGAPLDSKPTQPSVTSIPQPDLSTSPTFTPPSNNVAVAEGANPPHGQPGHDCAVAVGAPLNKK